MKSRFYFDLKVALVGTRPVVWRRIVIPAATTLNKVHDAIQSAMGWRNRRPYHFAAPTGLCYAQAAGMPAGRNPRKIELHALLRNPGDRLHYYYHCSEAWMHDVVLIGIRGSEPGSEAATGAGSCPPEDCGGVAGYRELQRNKDRAKRRRRPRPSRRAKLAHRSR